MFKFAVKDTLVDAKDVISGILVAAGAVEN